MAFDRSIEQAKKTARDWARPQVLLFDTEDRRETQLEQKLNLIGYRAERFLTPIGCTESVAKVLQQQKPKVVFIDRFLYASQSQLEAFVTSVKRYAPKALLVVQSRRDEPTPEQQAAAEAGGYAVVGGQDAAVVARLILRQIGQTPQRGG